MAAKNRKSPVWEFFKEPESVDKNGRSKATKVVPCKLCDQVLADGGGTTNLLNHLQSRHPEEYKRCRSPESQKSSSKQTSLSGIFKTCTAQHAASISDRIADFVAMDLRPLSVVEGQGFKRLLNFVEPNYTVPSRTHITTLCRRKYLSAKEQLLATLEAIPYVAVTSDIWTSRVTQAYITLTVHFITDSWKMDSMVLQTQEMPERHTGVNIHAQLSTASENGR